MKPPTSLARGIDAGLNRLGEALRTVEDRLRFDRSLPEFPGRWRELRLEVARLRSEIERRWGPLSLWRDVRGDPGAPKEGVLGPERRDAEDLLAANLARSREAARSVEEALRTALPELAGAAERLRYAIYEAESAATGLLCRGQRVKRVRLYVLLTTALASRPLVETAALAIDGGAQMVQLREKQMPPGELLPLARELREVTAERQVPLIINDHVEIAALCGADGVHQGQQDLPPQEVRKILGVHALVGVSTHAPDQAVQAERDGADYIGVGPIYATETKKHRAPVGTGAIRAAQRAVSIPGFAIGNINRETLKTVLEAGARRVAVCTGIIAQQDIAGTASWFREQLEGYALGECPG